MIVERELFENQPNWEGIRDLFVKSLREIPGVKARLYEFIWKENWNKFLTDYSDEERDFVIASYIVIGQKTHAEKRLKPEGELPIRNNYIFYQYLIGNMTYASIAYEHGISDTRVQQIIQSEKSAINTDLKIRFFNRSTKLE